MPFGLFKKPWEKVACNFELQEYGADGKRGWSSITEPTGAVPSKVQTSEFFRPGKHYRMMARSVEGETGGQFVGTVWQHYEPDLGLIGKKTERKKLPPAKKKDIVDTLDEYANEVDRVLTPITKIGDIFERIRQTFAPADGGGGGGGGETPIPMPNFEGTLPILLHPYVVQMLRKEAESFVDFSMKRVESVFGSGGLPKQPTEEDDEGLLPTIHDYGPKESTTQVEATTTETEDTGLPTLQETTEVETTTETEDTGLPTLQETEEPEAAGDLPLTILPEEIDVRPGIIGEEERASQVEETGIENGEVHVPTVEAKNDGERKEETEEET